MNVCRTCDILKCTFIEHLKFEMYMNMPKNDGETLLIEQFKAHHKSHKLSPTLGH